MFTVIKYIFSYCLIFSLNAGEGTKNSPLVFALVPGQDSIILKEQGELLQKFLEHETKLYVKLLIPTNFITVVESLGTGRVDIAILNPFGFLLAEKKYLAKAILKGEYRGKSEYYSQIITHVDGPNQISELNNKTFAYVDPVSTSGYILPQKTFIENKIKFRETHFAGKHDAVVAMVYQKRVDAGATYHTLANEQGPQDARLLVQTQYPDVFKKVKIIKTLGPIPSEPIVVRKDLNPKIIQKMKDGLKKFASTENGKNTIFKLYHLDNFVDANNSNWDELKQTLDLIGESAEKYLK